MPTSGQRGYSTLFSAIDPTPPPRYTPSVIRNIIFDWSGTLIDDLPAVWQATNYVLIQAQRPEISLDQFRADFCLPFTRFYDIYTPHVPLPQLEEWFHYRFRQVRDDVVALPYAHDFLEFCRRRKLNTFLLSTVSTEHFDPQARQTGLGQFLDHTYTSVRDKRQFIHDILDKHQLIPDETVFIGDMEHDIETARHGGIHAVAVLTGYNTLNQLRRAAPDLICEHLGELQTILQEHDLQLKPAIQKFEERHPPIATVGGLIYNDTGQILMIRTHKWSDLWGIPGGKIKRGETSEDALRRELKEETNLDIADIRFVLVQDCIHSKEFYREAHFVLLNYTCRAIGHMQVKLNEEAREYKWVTSAEALQMPLNQPTRVLIEATLA